MSEIAACVFTKFNQDSGELEVINESVYFYYNPVGATPNSYALVHNDRDYAMVKIMRVMTWEQAKHTSVNITKPLLAVVHYYVESYVSARSRLKDMQEQAKLERINASVDKLISAPEPSGCLDADRAAARSL